MVGSIINAGPGCAGRLVFPQNRTWTIDPGRRSRAAAGSRACLEKSFPEQHAPREKTCIHGTMATLVGDVSSSPCE